VAEPVEVYIEAGAKRVFACAYEWPGWCRGAKSEDVALESLVSYAPRYAPVAAVAKIPFDPNPSPHVVERIRGSVNTDFGVPHEVAPRDREPLNQEARRQMLSLVAAAWTVFDKVVEGAPAELRKGPRGGGRDRDKIVDHVLGAESAYARKIGLRPAQPSLDDATAIAASREALLRGLEEASTRSAEEKSWPAPYAARRIAWHLLDHAWEIEDRS
jgi:hypothetical protein